MPVLFFNTTDIDLLRLIHHHRPEELDSVFYFVSLSTTYISISIILGLLIASLVKRSKKIRAIFFRMLIVLIVAATLSFTLKNIFQRERPFKTYPDIEKLSQAGNSSFPSGHTLEVFAIATALAVMLRDRRIVIPVFLWALLVAYTRMALGVHYPSDVAGGMLLGSLVGWSVPFVFRKFHKRE